jgi:hypothetical protein
MKKIIMTLVLLGTLTSLTKAQTNECIKDFDFLIQKIKADYPGYSDKVTTKTAPELIKLEQELRKKIQLYPDSCRKYLSTYADWFKDHHLRVMRLRSSSNVTTSKPEIKYRIISADSLKILQSKKNTPEGIWHTYLGDIAIVKSSNVQVYIGTSISFRNYEKNQIVFTLTPEKQSEYALISYPYYDDYKPSKGKASIRLNDNIIELHDDNKRLVRKTNSETYDNAFLASYIPEFPNGSNTYPLALQLSDSTFYLRISSFGDERGNMLTKKHWKEIISSPNLIIDIRNNGGGQDNYYSLLSDLIYTQPYESKGVEWYATKNNIKMYEDAIKNGEIRNGEEGILWTKTLIAEMKKNVGKFVIHPMMGTDKTISEDTVYTYPKRIGIIINQGNASSAEQFLLSAKHSSKVTLFGNSNTAGVLDYSNAIIESLPSKKYELTFPMTRSRRLPNNPIDNIGISPDILIPYPATEQLFGRLDQWTYFVQNYLESVENKK